MHIHDKFYRFNKVSWASWLAEPHTWPRSETRVKPDIISWQMVHNLISDSTVFCSMNFTFRHYNDTSVVCNSTESGKYTHFLSVCCNNRSELFFCQGFSVVHIILTLIIMSLCKGSKLLKTDRMEVRRSSAYPVTFWHRNFDPVSDGNWFSL